MSKSKVTKAEAQKELIVTLNSCVEGYTGEWDPSGEGRDGFEAMYQGLVKVAQAYKINIKQARAI
jgi:hypothetical protein